MHLILLCCLALAEAADFRHFPVVTGDRRDPARTGGTHSPPAPPPGTRVRDSGRALQQSPSPTTERSRLSRNRSRGRSQTKRVKSGKKVEVTVAPTRQRARTRTQPPRKEISVDTLAFNAIERQPEASGKQSFQQPSLPAPTFQTQQESKTFSQSITDLFQPALASVEKQQRGFQESVPQTQTPRQNIPRFQNRPAPLRVFSEENQISLQVQSFKPQPIQSQPIQSQPIQSQPIQSQPIQSQPIPVQEIQNPPVQRNTFPTIDAQSLQLQPFQASSLPRQSAPAPALQERPPLFSTPLELPKQEGDGASFSFEAILG